MKKILTTFLACLILAVVPAGGQNRGTSDYYNHQKALEALFDEKDSEKALELLNKQLEDTPKHADSYYLRARIYYSNDK